MIVSSHTCSVWSSWKHVPKEIQDKFAQKGENELIIFVPKVVENGVQMPDFLKALNVGECVKFDYGTAYVCVSRINLDKATLNV